MLDKGNGLPYNDPTFHQQRITMKIKTADLIGPALDWAVAKVSSLEVYFDDGVVCLKGQPFDGNSHYWLPTQNWDQGGPIIERERISVEYTGNAGRQWFAKPPGSETRTRRQMKDGPTPLIAAMRCYVAYNFGDEIEIPDELV